MQPCPKFLSIIKRFWVNKNEICYMLPDYLVRCQLGNFFTNKMCIRHQQNVNLWLRSNHDFELSPKVHSSNINLWNFLVIISTQNYWASKKSPKKTETHLWAFNEIFFSKSLEGAEIIINHQTFFGYQILETHSYANAWHSWAPTLFLGGSQMEFPHVVVVIRTIKNGF